MSNNSNSTQTSATTGGTRTSKTPVWVTQLFAFFAEWPSVFLLMVLGLVAIVLWAMSSDGIPNESQIAAGAPGQAYERGGIALQTAFEQNGVTATAKTHTEEGGSTHNAQLLRTARDSNEGAYNIGLVEGKNLGRAPSNQKDNTAREDVNTTAEDGETSQDPVALLAVAPIFTSKIIVAVKATTLVEALPKNNGEDPVLSDFLATDPVYQRAVTEVLREQLADWSNVDCTSSDSGTADTAHRIRKHYCSFDDTVPKREVGPENPTVWIRHTAWLDEEKLASLRDGSFELVPINAGAFAQHVDFEEVEVPAGAYGHDAEGEPIPRGDLRTVGSTDYVAVRADASPALVLAILDAMFGDPSNFEWILNNQVIGNPGELAARPPIHMIPQSEIMKGQLDSRYHPAAQAYFQPFDPSELATWTEFLAGSKDLLVAIAAGVFLLYGLRVRLEKRAEDQKMREEKAILDEYLSRTITLEGEQWNCRDPDRLEKILAEVTAIKIEALDKLSHEDLRSDRAFSIFLMQCANVIHKIQMKILAYGGEGVAAPDE